MKAPDWDGLRREVMAKIAVVQRTWKACDEYGEDGAKVRREVLVPLLSKLAGFCAAIEVIRERVGLLPGD